MSVRHGSCAVARIGEPPPGPRGPRSGVAIQRNEGRRPRNNNLLPGSWECSIFVLNRLLKETTELSGSVETVSSTARRDRSIEAEPAGGRA